MVSDKNITSTLIKYDGVFSCYVIGNSGLTLRCIKLLLNAGHTILGVITTHPHLQAWLQRQGIVWADNLALLNDKQESYDYLFSIVNELILPSNILQQPRNFAVNFHDSLLPRYAGMYATSWAIMQGEQEHGVTWHVATDKIDAGDILKQRKFALEPTETAFSLNLKCYEEGAKAFAELITELAQGDYVRSKQDLTKRTYYGRHHKPPYGGFINWQAPAEEIERLVRALDFADQPNRIATAKFILNKKVYIIKNLSIASTRTLVQPGTIIQVTAQFLQIATGSNDILITEFYTVLAKKYSFDNFCKHDPLVITIGDCFMGSCPDYKEILDRIQKYSACEAFWVKQCANLTPLRLPFLPIAENLTKKNNKKLFAEVLISSELKTILKKQYSNVECHNIFLVILVIYFYRMSGEEKISLGLSHSSLIAELKTTLFNLFSNTVPFTIDLQDDLCFNDLLVKSSQQVKMIKNNFTYLQDIFYRYPHSLNNCQDLPITVIFSENINDLVIPEEGSLYFIFSANNVLGYINDQLDSVNQIKNILHNFSNQFLILLNAAISFPAKSIAKLPLLSKEQQNEMLSIWNQTEAYFPNSETIPGLFEKQVKSSPDDIAIVLENAEITYTELNDRANKFAASLLANGLEKGRYVVLCVDSGLFIAVALLACLKIGVIYVPVDPNLTITLIQDIFADTNANFIVTELFIYEHFFKKINWLNEKKIILINDSKFIYKKNLGNPRILIKPDDLVYAVYTSGSTGKPKGVLVSHKGLINCITAIKNFAKIKKNDVFLTITSLSFDMLVLAYYLPLILGSKIIVLSNEEKKEGKCLIQTIEKNKITVLQATPSSCALLHMLNWQVPLNNKIKILVGGEALNSKLAEFLQKNGEIYNMFGPTEATVCTTIAHITDSQSITIGKPIANTQVYVLDRNLQPLPVGFAGELYIGGVGLAKGYLNNPELTRERFIKNPFSADPTARIYKTGDKVRWLPNGELEYLGRLDNQVKVRGFRIELGEIEHALLRHPAIAQAVALVQTMPSGHKRLVAFVVLKPEHAAGLPAHVLPEFLQTILPSYMLPAHYATLTHLPLTNNGKVDKTALLAQLAQTRPSAAAVTLELPRTSLETQLVALWEQVLETSPISIHDNFFALGGDSILAIQLLACAERDYHLSFAVDDLLSAPTVAGLAQLIRELHPAPAENNEAYVRVPLLPVQHWFFHQAFILPQQWSQACLLAAKQPLNLDCLKEALCYLTLHYDALRMCYYHDAQGQPQQYLTADEAPFIFQHMQFAANLSLEAQIMSCGQQLQAQFDLEKGPLIGLAVWQEGEHANADKVLLVIHHLLIDGVSWRLLVPTLTEIYQKLLAEAELLQPSAPSYSEWAKALPTLANMPAIRQDQAYWLQTLAHGRPLKRDHPQGKNLEQDSKTVVAKLTPELTKFLLGPVQEIYQTHINEILLAALLTTFTQWQQDNTLLLDLESHGRQDNLVGLSSANRLGWFTSIFPLALALPAEQDWATVINSVKTQLRQVPRQGLSYGLLRYLCTDQAVREALAQAPKPEIAFNYWGQFNQALRGNQYFTWHSVRLLAGAQNLRTHLMNIDCVVQAEQFTMIWSYSTDCYEAATIAQLANNYQAQLTALLQHCLAVQAKQKQLPLLTQPALGPGIVAAYPLTPLQQGLLLQQWQGQNAESYEIQLKWISYRSLDLLALQQACQALIDRHDVLRTAFKWQDLAQPLQYVQRDAQLNYCCYDWQALSPAEQATKLNELLQADRADKIDLTVAPLLRVTVVQLASNHYVVIWRSHHIILDGWSFALLLGELAHYYQVAIMHNELPLPPPRPFKEYVAWLQSQDWTKAQLFWQNYLAGFTAPIDFSALSPKNSRSAITTSMQFSQLQLSAQTTAQLKQFAATQQVTVSTLMQTVWGILLQRYSQREDIIFGVTVAGRTAALPAMTERVGLFINTVPLRVALNSTLTVAAALQQVHQAFIALMPYSHVPLAHIEAWRQDKTQRPLFESIVVFENYPKAAQLTELTDFVRDLSYWDPTHYPLALLVIPQPQLTLKLAYDCSQITPVYAEQLLSQVAQLLAAMVAQPEGALAQLPIVPPLAQQQFFALQQGRRVPLAATVVQRFEQYAVTQPSQCAASMAGQDLSYAVLNYQANQLAHYLSSIGVPAQAPVACWLPRGLAWLTSLLAIWKAQAVYVPLDPELPLARLQTLLALANIKTIITRKDVVANSLAVNPEFFASYQLVYLDAMATQLADCAGSDPIAQSALTDAAYILFTSGTTGQPKGVVQTHQTLANLAQWQAEASAMPEPSNMMQFAALSFDVSLQEIAYAWSTGHSLHLAPSAAKQSLTELVAWITQEHITHIFLPTALLEPFCAAGLWLADSLRHLTAIFVAGEALKITPVIKEFFAKFTAVRLSNHYGPTETHVASAYQLAPTSQDWPYLPPIGLPIDNTELYVLDQRQALVPPGWVGELYIGGIGLASHYLGVDAAQPTSQFIPHPFKPGQHLYRSGDLARWHLNGQFEYVGRCDQQLKIRGYRIEPAEIEQAMLAQPGVKQCVVVARADQQGSLQLVAYITAASECAQSVPALQQAVAKVLPSHMMPTCIMCLPALPLTRHGKIDQAALPPPIWPAASEALGKDVQLSQPVVAALLPLWQTLLGKPLCSSQDNFFALGGHSLLALRLLLMIEQQFNVRLSLNDLLAAPTVAQLSVRLQQVQAGQALTHYALMDYAGTQWPSPLVPLRPQGDKSPLFLIHPVGGTIFWFLELVRYLTPGRPIYALQDPSILSNQDYFATLEEMATYYLFCLKKIQPVGPYCLAGASFGATVAVEIAKQLTEKGEQVAFVGLLDGWSFYPKELDNKPQFEHFMRRQLQELRQRFALHELGDAEKWLELQWRRNQLLWHYALKPLDLKLTLFKAEELYADLTWIDHPCNYWDDYSTQPIAVHRTPGNHETMLQYPHVQILADKINACLASCA